MSTATVKKVMQARLTRGASVVIADSFGTPALRGKKMVVTSKGPVKCNGKGRCAGDWCCGFAIFVSDTKSAKKDKEMGWRGGSKKICLTHVKDKDGVLLVPPPLLNPKPRRETAPARSSSRISGFVAETNGGGSSETHTGEVTWGDLAQAVQAGNLKQVAHFARLLKVENESLKSQVIEAQSKLIAHLTA